MKDTRDNEELKTCALHLDSCTFSIEVKRFIWKEPMAYSYICGPKPDAVYINWNKKVVNHKRLNRITERTSE